MTYPLPSAGVLRPAYIRRVAGVLETTPRATHGRELDLAHRILAALVDDGWRPPHYLEGIVAVTAYAGDALCERHGGGSRALPAKLRVARGGRAVLVCVDHAGLACFDLASDEDHPVAVPSDDGKPSETTEDDGRRKRRSDGL